MYLVFPFALTYTLIFLEQHQKHKQTQIESAWVRSEAHSKPTVK